MYLDYNEYKQYGGELEEIPFANAVYKACKIIDAYTFGRIEQPTESIKRCVFELVGVINSDHGSITSESNDGVSVSYNTEQSADVRCADIIQLYLANETTSDGTPLLYKGVETC